MSAFQPAKTNLKSYITFIYFGIFLVAECYVDIGSSGASNAQFSFFFRVEIEHKCTFQHPLLQTESTIHSHFFVNRKKSFNSRMVQRIIFKNSHHHSHTDAVIGSQSCGTRFYLIAIHIRFDRIFGKVMLDIRIFLWDHIEMRLQNHGLFRFETFGCRFADKHIANFILFSFQIERFAKIGNELGNLFHMTGRSGNLGEFIKMSPNTLRFQI
ncbi:MAG: hypothetical protein BWZ06_01391 [Bacteroidetes bacterium ADurb.BinA261]|nr:MAG: hypothetical protein BWZ06_01391 [Bacteroidetes bacterium ADurb.BinA261]